jgi:hypothetical protein
LLNACSRLLTMFLLESNSKQYHIGGKGYHWTSLSDYQLETELQTITRNYHCHLFAHLSDVKTRWIFA